MKSGFPWVGSTVSVASEAASRPLSMMRAHAPRLPQFAEVLRDTWVEWADAGDRLPAAFRVHRYGGTDEDRSAALSWIGDRVPSAQPSQVLVTNGTMNSLLLLAHRVVGRGGVMLVEELTFPILYKIAELAGVRIAGVSIDADGVDPDDFDAKCRELGPKAIYLNCAPHSPTAYVTPAKRRLAIVEVARRHGVRILEDEAQAKYLPAPPSSFASLAPEITWYLMGVSKYLPAGLRISFAVAPSAEELADVIGPMLPMTTWHPAPVVASLVGGWIADGRADALFAAACAEVHRRQSIVDEQLHELDGYRGSLGLHFWLPAPPGATGADFSAALERAGVLARPSHLYSGPASPRFEGIRPAVGELDDLTATLRAVETIREVHEAIGSR